MTKDTGSTGRDSKQRPDRRYEARGRRPERCRVTPRNSRFCFQKVSESQKDLVKHISKPTSGIGSCGKRTRKTWKMLYRKVSEKSFPEQMPQSTAKLKNIAKMGFQQIRRWFYLQPKRKRKSVNDQIKQAKDFISIWKRNQTSQSKFSEGERKWKEPRCREGARRPTCRNPFAEEGTPMAKGGQ